MRRCITIALSRKGRGCAKREMSILTHLSVHFGNRVEKRLQALCDKVCEILLEEGNICAVTSPATVAGDIHGQVGAGGGARGVTAARSFCRRRVVPRFCKCTVKARGASG